MVDSEASTTALGSKRPLWALAVAAAFVVLIVLFSLILFSRSTTLEPRLSVPSLSPPSVVKGYLITWKATGTFKFGTSVPDTRSNCALGDCWSVFVTAKGNLYPVEGRAGASRWHIAGPRLAGPGISLRRNRYISADPRSASRALIWISPNIFFSTDDGGKHWYIVSLIKARVAEGFYGSKSVGITIEFGERKNFGYYFTYTSNRGLVWRTGNGPSNYSPHGPSNHFKPPCFGS